MTGGAAVESDASSPSVFPRIPCLDGVRAIAVLTIVFHHGFLNSLPEKTTGIDHTISRVVYLGFMGVDLFFVLSGYLITSILDRSRCTESPLKTFYARRFVRIFPLYYGFLAFAMVFLRWLPPEMFGTTSHAWEWLYLTNVGIALKGLDTIGQTFGHFWSLSIEEHFYLLWPLVVLHVSRGALRRICVAIFVLSAAAGFIVSSMGHYVASYALTPTHLYSLASGALIAMIDVDYSKLLERWSRRVAWGIAAIIAGYVVLRYAGSPPEIVSLAYLISMIAFPTGIALLIQGKGGWVRSLLSVRPMREIGRISYGMYVLHVPILLICRAKGWMRPTVIAGHYFIYGTLFGLVLIGLSIIAGSISWNLWEKQFLKLAPAYRNRPRPAPSLATA